MPPAPTMPSGTALLESILVYLEGSFAPNGVHTACNAHLDIAITVEDIAITVEAPAGAAMDKFQHVFVVECLKCKGTIEITMADLMGGAKVAQPVDEKDWPSCSICHGKFWPRLTARRGATPAAQPGVCEACTSVSTDLGKIVEIRERESIL